MKTIHANDLHFAVKNPASRVDDYNEELFLCLDQILQLVKFFRAQAVCLSGDLFHDKDRALWSVAGRLLRWGQAVRDAGAEVFTIPGNHDMKHDRYDTAAHLPYGALLASGLFTDVSRRLVPFGPSTDGTVQPLRVYGIPWPDGGTSEAYAQIPPEADLVLAHGWATPDGDPRYGNWCAKYDELARQAPRVRLWHFGHDHSDNGVYTLKNSAKVINVGALARGALDTDNLTRQVKVAVADWFPGEVTVSQVALQLPSVDKIFDITNHARRVEERRVLEQFVQQFTANLGGGTVTVRYEDVLARTPLDAAVRASVEQYLKQAEEAS